MKLLKYLGISTGMGFLISLTFVFLSKLLDRHGGNDFAYFIERVMIVLWPTSIINLAGAAGGDLARNLLLSSIAANTIMYGIFGFFLWFGLNKCRWILPFLFAAVLYLWWYMLNS